LHLEVRSSAQTCALFSHTLIPRVYQNNFKTTQPVSLLRSLRLSSTESGVAMR
jgi:hypothetical protein